MAFDVIALWKDLHQIPELGLQEFKTSAYVAAKLKELGYYDVEEHFAGTTGVVAYARSGNPGPTVMLRADMDALPFKNDDGSVSAVHACGHDSHTAMLLTVASNMVGKVKRGTLKLVFQPAEETLEGALALVKGGIVDDVDEAYAMHIRAPSDVPYGCLCSSIRHTASSFIRIDVKGKSSHGARPNLGASAVEAAVAIAQAVANIKLNPLKGWSCKVTRIHSEAAAINIIPDTGVLWIDARTETNDMMDELMVKLERAAKGAAESVGATATVSVPKEPIPAPTYSAEAGQEAADLIVELFGKDHLVPPCEGGGEDFHHYSKAKPTLKNTYIGLGADVKPGVHIRSMTFNPEALPVGVKFMTALALKKVG